MAEYTYKDIIIDPTSEEAKNAVGKECYMYDVPARVLDVANQCNINYLFTLASINTKSVNHFVDSEDGCGWPCIIIKKEEPKPKPKYIPFENVTEFLDAHRSAPGCLNEEASYLSKNGIWLKGKASKAYYMVTKILDIGVLLVDDLDEITWEELLEYYTFLDDSPCGKEVKE